MPVDHDLSDSEQNRRLVQESLKSRCKVELESNRRKETQKLIDASGKEPRQAKMKALKDASWYAAEGKKRPRSPSPSGEVAAKRAKPSAVKAKQTKKVSVITPPKTPRKPASNKVVRAKQMKKIPAKKNKAIALDSDDADSSDSSKDSIESEEDGESSTESESSEDDELLSDDELKHRHEQEMPRSAPSKSGIAVTSDKEEPTDEMAPCSDEEEDSDKEELPCNLFATKVPVHKPAVKRVSARDTKMDTERAITVALADTNCNATARKSRSTKNQINKSSRSTTTYEFQGPVPSSTSQSSDDVEDVESDPEFEGVSESRELDWLPVVHLVPGRLHVQNVHVNKMVHKAVAMVEGYMIKKHAWPELHRSAQFRWDVLMDVLDELCKEDDQYERFREHVGIDKKFVKTIGSWFVNRLSIHRNAVKAQAACDSIDEYRLGKGPLCRARVKALLHGHGYVYPGAFGKAPTQPGVIWVAEGRDAANLQAYLNPAIIDCVAKTFFSGPSAFGFKYREFYVSSLPDDPATVGEPEITIPIVALGATAVYASLWEMRTGVKPGTNAKKIRFSGDTFISVYECHAGDLEKLKKTAPVPFHNLMAKIYELVSSNDSLSSSSHPNDNMPGPLAGIDFTGLGR